MQSTKTTTIITTAILILTLLTAGCTDTGGANPETVKYTAPPEEVPVVEETAAAELAPEPVETYWWSDKDYLSEGVIGADQNLFNENIEGMIYDGDKHSGLVYSMEVFSKTDGQLIFQHQEYPNLRLDLELSSDQYRTLNDQYGTMISATMETIDDDPTRAGMDKVAIKYVGSEGTFTYEQEYVEDTDVSWYIERFIEGDWDTLRPIFEEAGALN